MTCLFLVIANEMCAPFSSPGGGSKPFLKLSPFRGGPGWGCIPDCFAFQARNDE